MGKFRQAGVIARFFRRKNRGNPVKTVGFNTTLIGVVTHFFLHNKVVIGWAFLPTAKPQGFVVRWVSNPPTTPIGVAVKRFQVA